MSTTKHEPTNTVVICQLPKEIIKDIPVQLSSPFPLSGLVNWAQIRFMHRVLAVFETSLHAMAALPIIKERLALIDGCENVHIGFSISNTVTNHEQHLSLPDPGKLLFVSPPPSPPNEWASQLEEPPNTNVHYEQEFNNKLFAALTAVQTETQTESQTQSQTQNQTSLDTPQTPETRTFTLIPQQAHSPAIQVTEE